MSRRLQRIFLRLQNYSFDLRWKNGKQMYTSDTLSRAFITSADDEPTVDECNVEHLALIDDELRDNLNPTPYSRYRLLPARTKRTAPCAT